MAENYTTRVADRDEEAWQAVGETVAEVVRRSQPIPELFVVASHEGIRLRGELHEALSDAISALVGSGVIYMGEALGLGVDGACDPHTPADWMDINTLFYAKRDSAPDLQTVRLWSSRARKTQLRAVE